MDSSDDELLNDVTTQWETSLINRCKINSFFGSIDTDVSDPNDLPDAKSLEILFKKFGHRKFRPLQWKIINSILKYKRDNLAIMTTGYGKSLCYQFPAVYSNGIVLVISPLISLMEDQVLSLTIANIPACLLGSAQKSTAQTINDIFEHKYSLIYTTPEFCTGEFGHNLIKDMHSKLNMVLIAIDEAHCASSWGHDFRPKYRDLGKLKKSFPSVPILAVTATATEVVKKDIVKLLMLKNPQILCSGFDRPNLYLAAKPKSTSILSDFKLLMTRQDGHWVFDGSTIIYCIRRKEADEICEYLKDHDIPCLAYHAGMSLKARKEAHEQFVRDKVPVIVATVAFGMGIDKPDIRNVIHYGSPCSIEGYYQEIGRAGRDGLPSQCVTFYGPSDFTTRSFLIEKSGNSRRGLELLNLIKEYMLSSKCRRKFILSYFEENPNLSLSQRKECCDNCSSQNNCVDNSTMYEGVDDKGCYDFTDDFVKYLSAVEAMSGKFGNGIYILFLKGSKSNKIRSNYRNHHCYGSGNDKSENWWKAIANFLEVKNYLKKVGHDKGTYTYYTVDLSSKGRNFLTRPTKLLEQPTSEILHLLKKKQHPSGWISADGSTTLSANQSSTMVSTSQSKAVSNVETESQEKLAERLKIFRFLKNCRSQIAAANDCMPYMIASDFILMEMAIHRPRDLNELRLLQIEGLTEVKINNFGEQFLKIIQNNTSESFYACAADIKKPSIFDILEKHPIQTGSENSSIRMTYEYFEKSLCVEDVVSKRKLAKSTIIGHLIFMLKCGYPIKLEYLGVTPEIRCTIIQVINNLGGQCSLVSPIKAACPDNITYSQIQAVCSYLQVRVHLKELGIPYAEFEDFTFEEYNKDREVVSIDDDNDDLLSALCDEMDGHLEKNDKPCTSSSTASSDFSIPSKRAKSDEILDSPLSECTLSDIYTTFKHNNKPCTSSTASSDFSIPSKRAKSDVILDSPPRESVVILDSPPRVPFNVEDKCEQHPQKIVQNPDTRNITRSIINAQKKLPPWLSKKKKK